jgi:hypothetical protein
LRSRAFVRTPKSAAEIAKVCRRVVGPAAAEALAEVALG